MIEAIDACGHTDGWQPPPAKRRDVGGRKADVVIDTDAALPRGVLLVEWRKAGAGMFVVLSAAGSALSPVIRRGMKPVELEFRVTMVASAQHLRSAIIAAVDCDSNTPRLHFVRGITEHWHVSTAHNAETLQAVFRLPASAAPGVYGFGGEVAGRAGRAANDDSMLSNKAWSYDPHDRYSYPSVAFAVVDAD